MGEGARAKTVVDVDDSYARHARVEHGEEGCDTTEVRAVPDRERCWDGRRKREPERKPGTHGIVLQKGEHRALFLPQVAPEQGWDLETTLENLSIKAGLSPDAWKEGASFLVFQAEVFGEEL